VKLARCLEAVAAARNTISFDVYVCDSSDDADLARRVAEVCSRYPFVQLHRHDRLGLAAARNECSRVGHAPLLVSIDDDVYVFSDAIENLLAAYELAEGWRVVAGSVAWGERWSGPVVMRRIGYGRPARMDERPDFFVTALILYPRALAQAFPFNEGIRSSDDRFAGALWRSKGVALLYEPTARAKHDDDHTTGLFTAEHQDSHIYTNLFDALLVRRDPRLAMAFEVLGFAAGAKTYFRSALTAWRYVRAWLRGHRLLARDWRRLRHLVGSPMPRPADDV
jgi:glycosyltransferase involved in cell wall biosynthesis